MMSWLCKQTKRLFYKSWVNKSNTPGQILGKQLKQISSPSLWKKNSCPSLGEVKMSEGAKFICSSNYMQVWTQSSHHRVQGGDECPRGERVLICSIYRSTNPRENTKEIVKMLAEAGKRVSVSTVEVVLYHNGLKRQSERKKPGFQSQQRQLTVCKWTQEQNTCIFRDVSWVQMKSKTFLMIRTIVIFGGKRANITCLKKTW